jgi:hypothetical protein
MESAAPSYASKMRAALNSKLLTGLLWWFAPARGRVTRSVAKSSMPLLDSVFARCLLREADELERTAKSVEALDPPLARDLRLHAAEYRHQGQSLL